MLTWGFHLQTYFNWSTIHSTPVPGWALKWLNVITRSRRRSTESGSVTWLGTRASSQYKERLFGCGDFHYKDKTVVNLFLKFMVRLSRFVVVSKKFQTKVSLLKVVKVWPLFYFLAVALHAKYLCHCCHFWILYLSFLCFFRWMSFFNLQFLEEINHLLSTPNCLELFALEILESPVYIKMNKVNWCSVSGCTGTNRFQTISWCNVNLIRKKHVHFVCGITRNEQYLYMTSEYQPVPVKMCR